MALRVRSPKAKYTEQLTGLLNAWHESQQDGHQVDAAFVEHLIQRAGQDAWLLWRDGDLVGFGGLNVEEQLGHVRLWYYIHPDHDRMSARQCLLALAEDHLITRLEAADGPSESYFGLRVWRQDERTAASLRQAGFEVVREFKRMWVDLSAPPDVPALTNGFRIRKVNRYLDAPALAEAMNDAMRGHWGDFSASAEQWQAWLNAQSFISDVSFAVVHDDEIIAACTNRYLNDVTGWIGLIGVRHDWRGHGLGKALLLTSFGAFYEGGRRSVALSVDADNQTNAQALYERVGMRVERIYDFYAKRITKGGDSDA